MAALTAQQITVTGITPTWAAAASGGDTFENNGVEWLEVWNDHAGKCLLVPIGLERVLGIVRQLASNEQHADHRAQPGASYHHAAGRQHR